MNDAKQRNKLKEFLYLTSCGVMSGWWGTVKPTLPIKLIASYAVVDGVRLYLLDNFVHVFAATQHWPYRKATVDAVKTTLSIDQYKLLQMTWREFLVLERLLAQFYHVTGFIPDLAGQHTNPQAETIACMPSAEAEKISPNLMEMLRKYEAFHMLGL